MSAEERIRELMGYARVSQGMALSSRTEKQRRDNQLDALNHRVHALIVLLGHDCGIDVE